MSDIIDLADYLRRRDEAGGGPTSTFALWGADGERSRFALPLWRAIYLAAGDRGGILFRVEQSIRLKPFIVLDLARDPPRTDFPLSHGLGHQPREAPELREGSRGELTIYLGQHRHLLWYLAIDGAQARTDRLEARDREDILFLAGECAGLLFLRDLAEQADVSDE